MALFLKSVKSIKNSRNMNWRVHYIIPAAFIWASGLLFIRPLEVKLRKAYLAIKHRTSLTPFWALFFAGTALLPSFFPPLALSLPLRVPFCPTGPLSGAIEPPTCLHLPPASAARWVGCAETPSFHAPIFTRSLCFLNL